MSLQICLNCKELGLTWRMEDEERTWWFCSECDVEVEENESKECFCGEFNFLLPSASWLPKNGEGFYWCFSCNRKIDRIKEDATDYQALLKDFTETHS